MASCMSESGRGYKKRIKQIILENMKTLKYAWRFLIRSKSYTIINIIGLALSLACTIILVRYIHRELQVNTHCTDAENVYIPLRDIDGNVFQAV